MRWMIRLYPRAWRQRYGEEFALVLDDQRASPGMIMDVLGGAVDAWLHPQATTQQPTADDAADQDSSQQGSQYQNSEYDDSRNDDSRNNDSRQKDSQQKGSRQQVSRQQVSRDQISRQKDSSHQQDSANPSSQRQPDLQGADNMTSAMIRRCAVGGPKLSQRDQLIAGIWTAAGMLTLSTIYVILRKLYHGIPAVKALGYTAMPGFYVVYLQMAYLRGRSFITQALIVVGVLGSLYLALFAICAI